MTLRFVDSFARLGLEGDLKQPRGVTHTFFEEVDRCATGRKIYGESVDLHDRYSAPRLVRMRICHRNEIATKLCKVQTACSRRSVPTDGRARTVERMSVEDAAQPSRGRPNAHMIMPFGETSMTNDVTAEDDAAAPSTKSTPICGRSGSRCRQRRRMKAARRHTECAAWLGGSRADLQANRMTQVRWRPSASRMAQPSERPRGHPRRPSGPILNGRMAAIAAASDQPRSSWHRWARLDSRCLARPCCFRVSHALNRSRRRRSRPPPRSPRSRSASPLSPSRFRHHSSIGVTLLIPKSGTSFGRPSQDA